MLSVLAKFTGDQLRMTLTCPHCTKEVRLQVNPDIVKLLTPSEIELVREKMRTGESNKEIASRLKTSEQVIKNRLRDIYSALNVRNGVALAVLWFRSIVTTKPSPNPKSGQAA